MFTPYGHEARKHREAQRGFTARSLAIEDFGAAFAQVNEDAPARIARMPKLPGGAPLIVQDSMGQFQGLAGYDWPLD